MIQVQIREFSLNLNRYIDCEEAYKQCLWLEGRGYKPKPAPGAGGAAQAGDMGPRVGLYSSSPR